MNVRQHIFIGIRELVIVDIKSESYAVVYLTIATM